MDILENERSTARELISAAQGQGIDLEPLFQDGLFLKDQRWIFFWRGYRPPNAGPADRPLTALHYHMQGSISLLPSVLKGSEGAFRGVWFEAGTLENWDSAINLVSSWLVEDREVDEFPSRHVRRYGI